MSYSEAHASESDIRLLPKIVERLGSLEEVRLRAEGKVLIKKDELQSVGCGYLFLQLIYYRLGMDRICARLSKDHKFEYNLNAVMELLVYGRVIAPASKHATYLKADHSLASADVSLQHIYPGLDVIAGGFDYIQKRLYKNSLNVVRRDTTVLYYDCTNYFFETEQADPTCVEKDAEGNETGTVGLRQYGTSK